MVFGRSMPGGFMPGANEPCPMPKLTYASASARCQASSPRDRPPASGRKSYWPGGKAFSSTTVFLASRSQTSRNVCSSLPGIDEYSPLKVGRIPRNKLTARPAPTSDRNNHLISEWCTRRHMSVLERCGSNQIVATAKAARDGQEKHDSANGTRAGEFPDRRPTRRRNARTLARPPHSCMEHQRRR